MRYIKLFIFAITLSSLNSCGNCFGIYYNYDLYLKVQNEFGENLLNPENPNHIDVDSVYLYRISKDGCEIRLYAESMDISKSFIVIGKGDNSMLKILLDGNGIGLWHYHGNIEINDIEGSETKCTLLLKWNSQNTDTDTIFTTFAHLESTKKHPLPSGYCSWHLYDKVYYNGKLIVSSWEDNQEKMSQGIYPVIIK